MNDQQPRLSREVRAILESRARQYALAEQDRGATEELEVLEFVLGGERYAVELRQLRSVLRGRGLTAVPCTPPYVAGILNVRGEVITVLHLAVMLGLPAAATAVEGQVLLAEKGAEQVGLLVDEVAGVNRLDLGSLSRSVAGREVTRGLSPTGQVLLDVEQLFAANRWDVLEEVS